MSNYLTNFISIFVIALSEKWKLNSSIKKCMHKTDLKFKFSDEKQIKYLSTHVL